jgi:hypothetical protein
LVDDGVIDRVYLDFLVVGHTHSTIDQYFSVLANLIRKCDFIGSPMALWSLFETSLSADLRPKINRKIEVWIRIKLLLNIYYIFTFYSIAISL